MQQCHLSVGPQGTTKEDEMPSETIPSHPQIWLNFPVTDVMACERPHRRVLVKAACLTQQCRININIYACHMVLKYYPNISNQTVNSHLSLCSRAALVAVTISLSSSLACLTSAVFTDLFSSPLALASKV